MIGLAKYYPVQEAATTCHKQPVERRAITCPTQFDGGLLDVSNFFFTQATTFTTFTKSETRLRTERIDNLEEMIQDLAGDFDLVVPFSFTNRRVLKARIIKSEFNPTIVID